jgi:hypothetical protein
MMLCLGTVGSEPPQPLPLGAVGRGEEIVDQTAWSE